eukprot:Seg159.16 transcript_id=Seg159.16/GoldUCD/mRNA.D3Y31 product="hypothetical protein" protein_id=Seg159.16/GoldUCD/D3Y31
MLPAKSLLNFGTFLHILLQYSQGLQADTDDTTKTNTGRRGFPGMLECVNKLGDSSCTYYASLGYCDLRRGSMEQYCTRACNFCVDPPCHLSRYGCCFDQKTLAKGPNMLGCEDDCKDVIPKKMCIILKRNGRCYNQQIMKQCAVTCGYCRKCEDDDPNACKIAAKFGTCIFRKGQMANICRRSCQFCGKKDPCNKHFCPKESVCKVDKQLRPYCECHGNCQREDLYTGILCGRDGKEYKNLCALKKRNCGHAEKDQITVKKYGKCQDTSVLPSDKIVLCKKERKESSMCITWAAKGFCRKRPDAMRRLCPKACKLCAAQAAKQSCHYSKFGCCLDNKTTCLGTDYKGCPKSPACRDFSKVFCRRFVSICGANNHQERMRHYCPVSCNLCV